MPVQLQALGRAIKATQYRHHRTADARLGEIGTTLVQWDALRAIAKMPGATAHALATATFQSDQSFGTLAQRMETQGVIERRPGVGRRIEHHLTPLGKKTLTAGEKILDAMLAASFAPLGEKERATLLALLSKMAGAEEDAIARSQR